MSIRSAPSSWATPSRTSRPRRARGCRGGLGGALGERPRSAVLLLLLSSVSGAPVSGSDSAARQEAIDSLVARSSLVELQISGSRTGLVYRVGVEGCLPLRQSGPPRTLYLVAWSLGHTILPPRIQLHPPIGREQFTRAAPLMRSMALAADAGAWRNGISATQKEGKVKARSDHLLDEAAQDRTLLRRLEQQTDDGMAAVDETEILSETLDVGDGGEEEEEEEAAAQEESPGRAARASGEEEGADRAASFEDGEEDGEDECDQSAGEAAGLLILGSGECEDDQGSEPPSGGDADVEADAAFAHASEESAEL